MEAGNCRVDGGRELHQKSSEDVQAEIHRLSPEVCHIAKCQPSLFRTYCLHSCCYAVVREGGRQSEVTRLLSQESFIVADSRTNLY